MTKRRQVSWMLLPREQWAPRIRLCRERGARYEWKDSGLPLSDYEPCEVCGVNVVGARMADGEKTVLELSAVSGDAERLTAAVRLGARRHRCKGRAQ